MKTRPQNQIRDKLPVSASSRPFFVATLISALVIVGVSAYLAYEGRTSPTSQALGNAGIFAALVFTTIMCVRASRRRNYASRGWALMALSWFLAAAAQVVYTVNAVQGSTPSPVVGTITYLGYSVPVIAALFAFPKPPSLLISRFRQVLDALVITLGLLFISEATVLHVVWESGGLQTIAGWSGLAYPIADLAICSVVFTLGMRQPPRNRLTWLCLGSGLVRNGQYDGRQAHGRGEPHRMTSKSVMGRHAAAGLWAASAVWLAVTFPASEPGTVGTPASCASARLRSLSPIASIDSAVGPTKVSPCSSQRSRSSTRSARKP